MLAKSVCKAMILMEESLWGAPKRPACCIVGTQRMDRWGQSLQDYIPTQHDSNLFRYMHSFVWRYQLPIEKDFCRALAAVC